jgi:hypothetical protein
MKNINLSIIKISLLIVTFFTFIQCDKENKNDTTFSFPSTEKIEPQVYEEIKKTCATYWDLDKMIDSTFEIISDGDEFSVHCDGILDGQLYHFVIRTDSDGKWINDGRSIIQTSDDFLDITYLISYNDFEKIKAFILNHGDRYGGYSNMYNNNPNYSFSGFETYLNPEIGQLNINCDPEISDFNKIVIRDQSSDPQYFHLLIVRNGDLENEQIRITKNLSGLIEGKIYLLENYDYDLEDMAEKVSLYINEMIGEIE